MKIKNIDDPGFAFDPNIRLASGEDTENIRLILEKPVDDLSELSELIDGEEND